MPENDNETTALLSYVAEALGLTAQQADKLQERLWKFSAYVRQPRKDDRSCNKTPFFSRWDTDEKTSYLTPKDPRYASQKECQNVYNALLALLLEAHGILEPSSQAIALVEQMLNRSFQPQSLQCIHTREPISGNDIKRSIGYTTQRLGTYEISTSYRLELNAGGYHEHTNVGWMKPLHINYALRKALREHLIASGAPAKAIKNALDKIQVKSYCTDKQTMPPFFSNRDVRWATWPNSAQYASHYQCAMIEMELMVELYEFAGAPTLTEELNLETQKIRGRPIVRENRQCFVTGKTLKYEDYVQAAINPSGGRSSYHVGHIVPLTRGGKHAWDNIQWMSDDGNRIQGNNILEEIEAKLVDAVKYHLRRDISLEEISEGLSEKAESLWDMLNEVRERLGKTRHPW